jgi:hypothetical protein
VEAAKGQGRSRGLGWGIQLCSWNHWVDGQGGEGTATLAGIAVGKLKPLDMSAVNLGSNAEQARQLRQLRSTLLRWFAPGYFPDQIALRPGNGRGPALPSLHEDLLTQAERVREDTVELYESLAAVTHVC